MSRRAWRGVTVIGWTLLAGLVVLGEVGGPLQAIVGGVFLLACPGAGALVLAPRVDPIWQATLVVATSVILNVLVSEAVLFLTGWSSVGAFVVLAWISLAGALLLVMADRPETRAEVA